jgi:adenine phosphoribosyltransferase
MNPSETAGATGSHQEPGLKLARDAITRFIRTVPDWPAPGVQFQDITPLLHNPEAFRAVMEAFVLRYSGGPGNTLPKPDLVAGLDARGFILGAVLAYELGLGFVPIRKHGKLPFATLKETYALEYGSSTVELHVDAVQPGQRVVLMDDLIATGGTMLAGKLLLEKAGAQVIEGAAIINLPALGGAAKLNAAGLATFTLVDFAG